MASRWAKKKSGSPNATTAGPRTRSSWCRTACTIGFRTCGPARHATRATPGWRSSPSIASSIPNWPSHLDKMQKRELPDGWDKDIPVFPADPKGMAGRDASGKVENAIAKNLPWLIGGAADLAPSTKTRLTFEGAGDFEARQLRRPQPAFRHPRARHGLDAQRHGALEAAALRLGLPDLQRLHARRPSA